MKPDVGERLVPRLAPDEDAGRQERPSSGARGARAPSSCTIRDGFEEQAAEAAVAARDVAVGARRRREGGRRPLRGGRAPAAREQAEGEPIASARTRHARTNRAGASRSSVARGFCVALTAVGESYCVSASAPATTSRISCVISACRARFIASRSVSISSPAFFEALRMAVIRAPCSDAADSSSAR